MKNIKHISYKANKGFTLLFAVLVATLIVSIGATIVSIALRQTILSGTSRESQYAFYAANTALECAYYWDKTGSQGTESNIIFPVENGDRTDNLNNITCSGYDIVNEGELLEDGGVSTFNLVITNQVQELSSLPDFDFNYEYCASVTVIKTPSTNISGNIITRIEVKGYNTCVEDNLRRVERGLVQEYES